MSLGIVTRIDSLYEQAVTEPETIDDGYLASWAEPVFEDAGAEREVHRALRRAIRTARKLARYWEQRDPSVLPEWRHGVDEALGGLGWQAQLDLLVAALRAGPDPEIFAAVRDRHRQVHFTEWMQGVSYEEWVAERGQV